MEGGQGRREEEVSASGLAALKRLETNAHTLAGNVFTTAVGEDGSDTPASIEDETPISSADGTNGGLRSLSQELGDTCDDGVEHAHNGATATDHFTTGTARSTESSTRTSSSSPAPDHSADELYSSSTEHTPCVTAGLHDYTSGDTSPSSPHANEALVATATAQNEQEVAGSLPEPPGQQEEKPHAQKGGEKLKQEDPPMLSAAPVDDRTCRICFCGPEEGRLISPCLCKGSMKYVHLLCLQHWRTASANTKRSVRAYSYTHTRLVVLCGHICITSGTV